MVCGLVAGTLAACAHPRPPSVTLPPRLLDCSAPATCVRLLSWNVHGIPGKHVASRFERIAEVIRDQAPDVVVLQEVWLACHQRRMADALAREYEPVFQPRGGPIWGPKGGLMTFVRRGGPWHPGGTAPSFQPYDAHATGITRLFEGDGVSRKGALRVALDGDHGSLCIVATHLQSQYPEFGANHLYVPERSAQIRQLADIAAGCGKRATLVVGDFNTSQTETELYDRMKQLGADLTEPGRAECDHGCGSHFTDDHTKWEWIDYIFSPTPGVHADVARIVNEREDVPYSDHDGLLARVVFPHAAL